MSSEYAELFPKLPDALGFRAEHALLVQEARRFLAERCPFAHVRALAEDPLGHDPTLWRELGRMGWFGLLAPERWGGADLGHLALALLLEETGRALLPAPLFAQTLATWLLATGESNPQHEHFGTALVSGELSASLACEAPGAFGDGTPTATPIARNSGFALRGRFNHVLAGNQADLLIAPFRTENGKLDIFCIQLESRGVEREAEISIDPTRRTAHVLLNNVHVDAGARLPVEGETLWSTFTLRAAALLAAETVGVADAVLARTCDYVKQRVQFEKPIGAFQAVKHPLVDLLVGIELTRNCTLAAVAALDSDLEGAEVPVHMAKALASEVGVEAGRCGVQLHGGYGFTWDCDAHFYLKRALANRALFGDAYYHRRFLANRLLD